MAISVVFPIACQRVVAVLLGQRLIIRQSRDDGDEITLQRLPMRASGFAFQVSLELARLLNRPHQAPLAVRQVSQFPDCHGALLS